MNKANYQILVIWLKAKMFVDQWFWSFYCTKAFSENKSSGNSMFFVLLSSFSFAFGGTSVALKTRMKCVLCFMLNGNYIV